MSKSALKEAPVSTGRKQIKTQFKKGQSGNPAGRPKGSRHKATLAIEALLDGEAEAITRRAVEMALEGDTTAMRLVMDRLCPPRRDRPVAFDLPKLEMPSDAVKAMGAITQAVSEGELTPSEAGELMKLVESFIKAVEVHDIQRRLEKLEAAQETK
jgi:hypothetical protein